MRILALLSAITVGSCCPTPLIQSEYAVHVDTVKIDVPVVIHDTIGTPIIADTSGWIFGDSSFHVSGRIDTVTKRVYVHVRDTVTVEYHDTVSITNTKVEYKTLEPSKTWIFFHSAEFWLSALVLGALLATGAILYLIRKFRK